tara:strand:+ start:1008 stop:1358 length:351 start_codon:yes stop_codon:yes gene_type:complete
LFGDGASTIEIAHEGRRKHVGGLLLEEGVGSAVGHRKKHGGQGRTHDRQCGKKGAGTAGAVLAASGRLGHGATRLIPDVLADGGLRHLLAVSDADGSSARRQAVPLTRSETVKVGE